MDKGNDDQRSREIAEKIKAASPNQPGKSGCARATEWTVLIVILLMLGFCALTFIPHPSVPEKAKEAEVKQNLHAIQLAVERYAVDMDGAYPPFLYGGEALINIGTVNFHNPAGRNGAEYWDKPIHLPFDVWNKDTDGWDYYDLTWEMLTGPTEDLPSAFGDVLAYEGYLPKYPTNPFQVNKTAWQFSLEAVMHTTAAVTPYAGYGGRDGRKMFNLGCFGELPQLMMESDDKPAEPRLDFPGSFYYHPRWKDEVTNLGHNLAVKAGNPGSWMPGDVGEACAGLLDDSAQVENQLVSGYELAAFGSVRTKGMDLDNSVSAAGMAHFFRTGYLTAVQERNPWVGPNAPEGNYEGMVVDFDKRPYSDSVPDFYIIHLDSGMDKKAYDPMAAY